MNPGASERMVVSGAGLAGSLLALLLARRGFSVDVYEKREDLRSARAPSGRSINLALSERGIHALRVAGLADIVLRETIEMRGRMIHDLDGSTRLLPYGQRPDEVIRSVSRAGLNRIILEAAGEEKGVNLHFQHAVQDLDLESKNALVRGPFEQEWEVPFDVLFGADGAGSPVRAALERDGHLFARQEMLDHGYKELTIPSGPHGGFRIDPNALHIWPRGTFMLIALPNLDGSFTCTLFMPMDGEPGFASLNDAASVEAFFEARFPDAIALIPQLSAEFAANPTGTLGTIRCSSWSHEGDVLILGDAAHAIVPFFGQGMNGAFEDCSELDAMLESALKNGSVNASALFNRFEQERIPNAEAIADMALDNYLEMRDRVADPAFRLQRAVALELERRYPNRFIPKYSLVSFHRIPYAEAKHRGEQQAAVLRDVCDGLDGIDDVDWTQAERLVAALPWTGA